MNKKIYQNLQFLRLNPTLWIHIIYTYSIFLNEIIKKFESLKYIFISNTYLTFIE